MEIWVIYDPYGKPVRNPQTRQPYSYPTEGLARVVIDDWRRIDGVPYYTRNVMANGPTADD